MPNYRGIKYPYNRAGYAALAKAKAKAKSGGNKRAAGPVRKTKPKRGKR